MRYVNIRTDHVIKLTIGTSDDGQEKANEDAPENNPSA